MLRFYKDLCPNLISMILAILMIVWQLVISADLCSFINDVGKFETEHRLLE